MRASLTLLAITSIGCASTSAPPALPFDVRPAMASVRADAARVAAALDRGELRAGIEPAARLASMHLGAGHDPAPALFLDHERAFAEQAEALRLCLEAGDRARAGRAFELLLLRCDACHERYRPGGVAGLAGR